MLTIIPFQFDSLRIRVVAIDGEPWFVGRDVAQALGYADLANAVKQHARGAARYHPIVDAMGRAQEARIIGEPDLFRMIVGSHLPSAERFERWVFEQVLPQIRRTGRYSASPFAVPQTLSEALRLAADLSEHNEKLLAQVKEQAPKVAALERISEADGALCLRDAAKSLRVKPRQLTAWLAEHGWIFRRAGHWVAYQAHVDNRDLIMRTVTRKVITDAGERERLFDQVLITAKGMTRVARQLSAPATTPASAEREISRCVEVLH